jgi:hypothetical protein
MHFRRLLSSSLKNASNAFRAVDRAFYILCLARSVREILNKESLNRYQNVCFLVLYSKCEGMLMKPHRAHYGIESRRTDANALRLE